MPIEPVVQPSVPVETTIFPLASLTVSEYGLVAISTVMSALCSVSCAASTPSPQSGEPQPVSASEATSACRT